MTYLATFSFTHPYLIHFDVPNTTDEVFAAHLWSASLAGLFLAAIDLVVLSWLLRKFPRVHNFILDGYSRSYGTLGYLLSRAEFASGSGLCIKNKKGVILSCNKTLLKPFKLEQSEVIGRQVDEVFPPRVAAAFRDVEARALSTRTTASLDLQRRADLPDEGISAIRITATPIFYDDSPDKFAGFIVITRDITELKLVEQAAFKCRMDYRHLMDNVPLVVSICRFLPSNGSDIPDFEVLESSAAWRPLAEETNFQEMASFFDQYPAFAKNREFLETLRRIRDGGPPERLQLFWESIGRTFDCSYAGFGENSFSVMSRDITESLQSEGQVLRLNDLLFRTRAETRSSMEALLSDYNTFMHAVVERVQKPLVQLRNTSQHIQNDEFKAYQAATLRIQATMEQVLRYSNASMLPYTPALLDLNITTSQLTVNLAQIHPGVVFEASRLPVLRTSEPVFRSILKNLLTMLIDGRPGQVIKICAEHRFMDTLICIGPISTHNPIVDLSALQGETNEWVALGWDISENLDLALTRRLVAYHGGDLLLRPHCVDGSYIGFTLAAPVPYVLPQGLE